VTVGDLDGKVAIVTGGARGLGRAIAELFVESGARVVIADVDADTGHTTATELGANADFARTDVGDAEAVQAAVDFAVERFGALHIMCNNAGISASPRPFLGDDLRNFDVEVRVNLFGVLVGCQRAARHMAQHGGGSIVNITSIGGINAGPGLMTYRATKAAVVHVTKSLAIEFAEHNIRVNCIAPAHIATDINAAFDQGRIVRRMQPLQRLGSPRDVAEAALYLASDRSAQVTGIVLPVDGGTTAGRPMLDVNEVLARRDARDA
jgi:NAD(P)-dependent dehydrogenase (short-subunit alcohol dehydrogenase family)